MRDHERDRRKREREADRKHTQPTRKEIRKRLNPRIVFNDPNTFFHELLMEQQEQG